MKASKQRRRAGRTSKQAMKAPKATPAPAFSDDEEAFFRAGVALEAAADSADEVDDPADRRRSLWQRLFARGIRANAA